MLFANTNRLIAVYHTFSIFTAFGLAVGHIAVGIITAVVTIAVRFSIAKINTICSV